MCVLYVLSDHFLVVLMTFPFVVSLFAVVCLCLPLFAFVCRCLLLFAVVCLLTKKISKKKITVTLIRMTGSIEERWNLVWVLEASPDVLYLIVFVSIMVLWRPKPNSKRYAYYEQAGTRDRTATLDDDDFDADFSDGEDEYLPDEFDEDMMNEVGKEIEMTEHGDEEFSLGYQDEYEEDDDDIVA